MFGRGLMIILDSPYYSEIEEDDPEELTSGFDPLKMSGGEERCLEDVF